MKDPFTRAFLFHGSGSETKAREVAEGSDGLLIPPVTGSPIKIDQIRMVVEILGHKDPTGLDRKLLVGPLDGAHWSACDALLKSLEELDSDSAQPVFWAVSLNGLPLTLLSRCRLTYCPGDSNLSLEASKELWISLKEKDLGKALKLVDQAENEANVVEGLAQHIRVSRDMEFVDRMRIWTILRTRLTGVRPTRLQLSAVICDLIGED